LLRAMRIATKSSPAHRQIDGWLRTLGNHSYEQGWRLEVESIRLDEAIGLALLQARRGDAARPASDDSRLPAVALGRNAAVDGTLVVRYPSDAYERAVVLVSKSMKTCQYLVAAQAALSGTHPELAGQLRRLVTDALGQRAVELEVDTSGNFVGAI
jgi:hypothetical protein